MEKSFIVWYTRYDMPTGIYKRKPRTLKVKPLDRFLSKVNKTGECWNWVARVDKDGYGVFSLNRKNVRAHRYSYEEYKGKIGSGLVIDHLCRNKSCVNPDHMETVTNKENILRGFWGGAINHRKTHCINGHPLSGKNLYVQVKTGKRYCRTCDRRRGTEYEKRKKQNNETK